jgi:hypothetical protein
MSEKKRVEHLRQVAMMVQRLETYLSTQGSLNPEALAQLAQIRMALVDNLYLAVPQESGPPCFSSQRTPEPI